MTLTTAAAPQVVVASANLSVLAAFEFAGVPRDGYAIRLTSDLDKRLYAFNASTFEVNVDNSDVFVNAEFVAEAIPEKQRAEKITQVNFIFLLVAIAAYLAFEERVLVDEREGGGG